jgi:hypothetical protein
VLLQLSIRLQGRTFGAPNLTAPAVDSEDGREQPRGKERPGWAAVGGRGSPLVSPLRGGSFAASFGRKPYGAAAAAHGTPVTGRLRSPPYPAAAHASTTALRHACARCAGSREDVIATGPDRRALSGLAPPASTVLRIPLRGTRLRRAVDPEDLCQPSGPDGEGQAKRPGPERARRTSGVTRIGWETDKCEHRDQ